MHADTTARAGVMPGTAEGSAPVLPTLAAIERDAIEDRIDRMCGNKTKAAKSLGIALKTLYNRLATYRAADAHKASAA